MPISRVSQLLLARRLVQSTGCNGIPVLQRSLFNFLRGEKWVAWVTWSPAVGLVKGQRAEQLQTLPAVWKLGVAKGWGHKRSARCRRKISTFHQREGSSWMACDGSCYWVISGFQVTGGNGAGWLHAFRIYISFPALYFQQKIIFPWFSWRGKATFTCEMHPLRSLCVCWREEHSIIWLRCCGAAKFSLLSSSILPNQIN